jgi:uroporphyrinogen-III decarboxylase
MGTLPEKWRDSTMWDIIRDIGGLLYYPNIPTWRERLWGVQIVETVDGKVTGADQPMALCYSGREAWSRGQDWGQTMVTEYRTPRGTVTTKHVWTQDMALGGVQSPQLRERMIKSVDDYPVVEYLLEHTEYLPSYELIEEVATESGDNGLPIGGAGWTAIHSLMYEYIGYDQCFYHMYDYPREFERLLQILRERRLEVRRTAALSPAQILMVGCNWSDSITSPSIFGEYFLPELAEAVNLVHAHGKLTTCHVDGDMRRLLKLFTQTGVDVAEALAPHPMGNYTLAEAREAFGDRMTIWGGIPTPLFTDSYSDEEFDDYVRDIIATVAPRGRFVLSMGDNIPPNGVFQRVYRVAGLLDEPGHGATGTSGIWAGGKRDRPGED